MTIDSPDRPETSAPAAHLHANHADTDASSLAALFRTLGNLKRIRRTGWVDRGVPRDEVESVADHSFLSTIIAWVVASDNTALDADRVLKMALIHDLAEATFGDAPPYEPGDVPDRADVDAVRTFFSINHVRSAGNAADKRIGEDAAMAELLAPMPDRLRDEMAGLWAEYEAQETPEARFVKEVDRLEAFLEARYLEDAHPGLPLAGFTIMAERQIDDPALTAIRDAARSTGADGNGG